MSQSIRVGSGLVPIIQHVPYTSSSSSCRFVSTPGHTDRVGFPRNNLCMKECSKRAWISNRHHPAGLPFLLPCAATMKKSSNVDLDHEDDDNDDTSCNKVKKYDNPLKVGWLQVSQAWRTMLSNLSRALYYRLSKLVCYRISRVGVLTTMIYLFLSDPIDGLKVLLDVSQTWRMILSSSDDDLYDGKGFHDYGESYYRKARPEGSTKNPPLKLTQTSLTMLRVLASLDDPFDGLKFLSGDLELWSKFFSGDGDSDKLNDSEGYLQKELFALRDLSQRAARISVSNRNDKHDEAKNPSLQIPHVVELLRFKVAHTKNMSDLHDALETMRESFRSRDETSGPLVTADRCQV